MNLEECYEAMDSDYDDVMRRLGSETLVRKFVLKFLDDTSFQGLKEGLENQDAELAFRSAHQPWNHQFLSFRLLLERGVPAESDTYH